MLAIRAHHHLMMSDNARLGCGRPSVFGNQKVIALSRAFFFDGKSNAIAFVIVSGYSNHAGVGPEGHEISEHVGRATQMR